LTLFIAVLCVLLAMPQPFVLSVLALVRLA
jgi:hypothetical protein